MKYDFRYIFISLCILFIASTISHANNKQIIAGAGPSTAVVQLFVEKFASEPVAQKYTFKVPPKSAKHAGGITNSDIYIFGRTGRPLNEKEIALGKKELFLGRVPIAFAAGNKVPISSLTLEQLEGLFTGKITNWEYVGGSNSKIYIIGREPNEALFSVLKKAYSFFNQTKFHFVVKKDNHVIDLLQKPEGEFAIGFGSEPNFQKASVKILSIDGFSTGVSLGLVYDNRNEDHELVKAAKLFAESKDWANIVKSIGMLPPE